MLNAMKNITAILLAAVLTVTAGLFLAARAERLLEASPAQEETTGPQAEQKGADTALPADPAPQTAPPGGEPAEEGPALYPFFAPALPEGAAKSGAQLLLFLMGEGREGNFWLLEKRGETWYNAGGPYFCRAGEGGVPLFGGYEIKSVKFGPEGAVSAELSPCPEGGGAKFLFSGAEGGPAPGICAGARDVSRVLSALSPAKSPLAAVLCAEESGWAVEKGMPEGFVFLSEAVPGILEDARYSHGDNFMGRPMAGYIGNRVVVAEDVAAALAAAQSALEKRGLSLLVFDGYRPKRAVEDIFAWLGDPDDEGEKERFYPGLSKSALPGIYLADNSRHTSGCAVDVTVADLGTGEQLDMGTGFDFFSESSWYSSGDITRAQAENRRLLRTAMESAGFTAYSMEWWHFNFESARGGRAYDFVIPQ